MATSIKIPENLQHSLWSVLDAALYPVAYMALVPLLMKSMGAEVFGFYIILNSITIVLQLFNFNMGVTALRNVSFELAKGNLNCVRDLVNGMVHITLLLFIGAVCTGVVIGILAVKFRWWDINSSNLSAAFWCVLLAAIFAGLKYFDQIFQNTLKAFIQFKSAAILNLTSRMGVLLITLAMALHGYPLLVILAANVLYYLLFLTVEIFVLKATASYLNAGWLNDNEQYRRLMHFSLWPWLQSLVIVLTFQTDRFWVSAFSGLKTVSHYGLVSTMFNHIHMIFAAIAAWVLPRISGMVAKGENPAALYGNMRNLLLSFITLSLLLFHFLSPYIFNVWIGESTYLEMSGYVSAFIGFELAFAHTIMPILFLNAAGKEKMATGVTFLFCFVCYLFMLTGISYLGNPMGLISGMTLSMCITMPIVNKLTSNKLGIQQRWDQAITEMLPVYISIFIVNTANIPAIFIGVIAVMWLLWRYYIAQIINNKSWRLATNT